MNTRAETRYGTVQGTVQEGIRVWRGIPFAAPPVGSLRFRAPQEPEHWEGVREAVEAGPIAMQPVVKEAGRMSSQASAEVRSEDCLYLNIWSPAEGQGETAARGLPVMLWIHGGAFVSGAGSLALYDGAPFVSSGEMVLVTINYRLGPFGFLHLASLGGELESNLGLLDQVAALRWVRDNIAAFGGDPERVTVFGESAGSMSIAALLAMPAAKGLFQRAILQSGAAQVMQPGEAAQIARGVLAELAALSGSSLAEASAPGWLESRSAEDILEAGERLKAKLSQGGIAPLLFQPVLEPATLPLEPDEAVREGSAAGVELLIGTNHDEGAYFIRQGAPVLQREQVVQLLGQFGFADPAVLADAYEVSNEGQAELVTDLIFWEPSLRLAEAQLPHAKVWMYRFDWCLEGHPHPFVSKSVHALEIPFVFRNLFFLEGMIGSLEPQAEELAQRMQKAWIRFATTRETDSLADWDAYETERRTTWVFNREDKLVTDPDREKRLLLTEAAVEKQ
ncbi:carboxylesterase/lipase family protein [Gorillibacterium sp. CAU 1737]|uniref:carboxylesterase/lipase family protein n=1 Tax=Gorillibacterium sp. CAU 1737 TaxID=3140362 RepID=UPI003261131B